MIRVSSNSRVAQKALQATLKQFPYAFARSLNAVTNDVQTEEQDHTERVFAVKQRTFIRRTIKRNRGVDFATKDRLEARVGIDPQRNMLAKHEAGGRKVSLQGKPFVAVPSRDIKRTKRGLVPRSLYPTAFKPFTEATNRSAFGGRHVQAVGQKNTYILNLGYRGWRMLVQRQGKGRTRGLYVFMPSVNLGPGRLHFVKNARRVVSQKFRAHWEREFAGAIATAKVR